MRHAQDRTLESFPAQSQGVVLQNTVPLCAPKRACHSSMPARSALTTRARTAARVGVSHGPAASVGAGASSRWQCSTAARGSPGCRADAFDGRARKPAERIQF